MVFTAMHRFLIHGRPSILAGGRKRQEQLVDFYHLAGYFSGLLFIKPDMAPASLWPTLALVHTLDAILCGVIANQSGRNKLGWMVAGLFCGIWALGALFFLPAKTPRGN
jgi:hypothetical protein